MKQTAQQKQRQKATFAVVIKRLTEPDWVHGEITEKQIEPITLVDFDVSANNTLAVGLRWSRSTTNESLFSVIELYPKLS